MAEDIAPKLIENVLKKFQENLKSDEELLSLYRLMTEENANYRDADAFAKKVGVILANILAEEITPDSLPDGRMYYNIANRLMNTVLAQDFNIITEYTTNVQKSLNKKANINIKAQVPKINQSRIDGMIDRLSDEPKFENISWMLNQPVVNFTQSIVDDAVQVNADFQYNSGYDGTKVYRIAHGTTCKWCNSRAGIWKYGDLIDSGMVKEVFRRHENCDCEVYYDDGSGFLEDIHKKSLLKDTRGKFDKLVRKDYGLKEKNIDDYKKQFEREAKITEQNKFNDAVKRNERIAKEGNQHPDMDDSKLQERIQISNGLIDYQTGGKVFRSYYEESEYKNAKAEKHYEIIKSRNDTQAISDASGMSIEEVRRIKKHVFFDTHILYERVGMFDSDYDMAVAWERLTNGTPLPRDIVLLKHELLEEELEKKYNYSAEEAHRKANEVYNWEKILVEETDGKGEDNDLL